MRQHHSKGPLVPGDQKSTSRSKRINWLVLFVVAAVLAAVAAVSGTVLVAGRSDVTPTVVSAGHYMAPAHMTPKARRGELEVLVGDYWFKPSSLRLRAGVYRFVARNYGVVQHDVMVERTPITYSAPGEPVDEAAPFGVDGLRPGMTKTTTVTLTAGRWEVFCSLPGHYQAGQHQVLTVYGRAPRGMRAPKPMGMGKS